jgi:DNA repair exonuclease SbcCD nuclease subunit
MTKICFIGDIHGKNGNPLGRLCDYNEDLYKKLEWVINYCNTNNVSTIVHLGDIHDKWSASDEWKNKMIKILREFKGEFLTLIGNHDEPYGNEQFHYQTCLHNLELAGVLKILREPKIIDNITLLTPLTLSITKAKKELKEAIDNAPVGAELIFVGHHFYNFGLEPSAGFVTEDLKKVDVKCSLILGHDHRQYDTEQVDMVTIYRPGSLMRTELAESMLNHKSRVLIYEPGSFSYVEVPHRNINEIYDVTEYMSRKTDARMMTRLKNNLEDIGNYLHKNDAVIPCSQALKELNCPIEEFNYIKTAYQVCGQEF